MPTQTTRPRLEQWLGNPRSFEYSGRFTIIWMPIIAFQSWMKKVQVFPGFSGWAMPLWEARLHKRVVASYQPRVWNLKGNPWELDLMSGGWGVGGWEIKLFQIWRWIMSRVWWLNIHVFSWFSGCDVLLVFSMFSNLICLNEFGQLLGKGQSLVEDNSVSHDCKECCL